MEDTENQKTQENYTEREAALWLKISRATLQRARYRNEVSFYRMGTTASFMRGGISSHTACGASG